MADISSESQATATERPQAQTLPRNFTFHLTDPPRTPSPFNAVDNTFNEPPAPPPAPPQKYQIRRRRNAPAFRQQPETENAVGLWAAGPIHDQHTPIPSIEVCEPFANTFALGFSAIPCRAPVSPPKTPVDKLIGDEDQIIAASRVWEYDWEKQGRAEDEEFTANSPPSTAYSRGSNSSLASTVRSYPSDATMATSPELGPSDTPDADRVPLPSSPLDKKSVPSLVHVRSNINPLWTNEMDGHLWCTFLRYLEDPTHTPFKLLPGHPPPIGVCERVAREAKRSWKAAVPASTFKRTFGLAFSEGPNNAHYLGAATDHSKRKAQWPKHDAAVRRRLKELCKRQPMLAPHYARLALRTPSPFRSSSMPPTSPPPAPNRNATSSAAGPRNSVGSALPQESFRFASIASCIESEISPAGPANPSFGDSSFSVRDMNLSLATSTATTMQPGGYFAQLAQEQEPATPQLPRRASDNVTTPIHQKTPIRNASEPSAAHEETSLDIPPSSNLPSAASPLVQSSANRTNVSAHQKSHSLHHNFFGRGALFGSSGTLASPFAPRPSLPKAETVRESKRPSLDSPIQLAQPVPKRRRECDSILKIDDDPFLCSPRKRSEPFVPSADALRNIYRMRGSTVGAFGLNPRNFQQLRPSLYTQFPPPRFNLPREEEPEIISGVGLAPPTTLAHPPRLASPFRPEAHANTFPRNAPINGLNDTVMADAPPSTPPPSRYNPAPARRGLQGLFAEWHYPA